MKENYVAARLANPRHLIADLNHRAIVETIEKMRFFRRVRRVSHNKVVRVVRDWNTLAVRDDVRPQFRFDIDGCSFRILEAP